MKKKAANYILAAVMAIVLFLASVPLQAAILEIDTINPVVVIEKVNMDQAVAGSEFTMSISVRNLTNNPGFDLGFSFQVKDTDGLAPFSLLPNQTTAIEELKANETRTILLTFSVAEDAQNKDYELLINLTGKNAEGSEVVHAGTTAKVPVTYDLTKPVLSVVSASVSPENPDPAEEFEVHFRIKNLSNTTDARNVVMLLNGTDNFEITEITNKKNLAKLEKGQDTVVTYGLKSKDTRIDNTVKLTMSFDYLGNQTTSIDETINLPLFWDEVGTGTTPWVIVNKYTLSAERILAGNTVNLKLYIENTNQRPVKNVKISLGVIKIEETSGSVSTTTSGGTVFSPVNSSNSFYLEQIPGRTVIEKDVDLYVDPNAAAKTYIVPVEIKYEDRTGKLLECEEMVNIPVTQECKLNILSVQVPPQGSVGQPIPVMAEFVNVGKVALGNFMVRLDGDFEKENATYYIGNFDIGYSDFFQGMVIPSKEGTLEGKVVFSYIDNNNKDVEVEEPFTIEVSSMPTPGPGMEGDMMGGPGMKPGIVGRPQPGAGPIGFVKTNWLYILLGLVIVAEALVIWRVRRKKTGEEFFNE